MKKLLVIWSLALATLCSFAEGHMTFKGIEIDGDLESFKSKLEKQGFAGVVEDGAGAMTGMFTGEGVMVGFYPTLISKKVYKVVVIYPPQPQWSLTESKYRGLVENLKNKYGAPKESIWKVDAFGDPEYELIRDRAVFVTRFEVANGGVTIGIQNLPEFGVSVYIVYWDRKNDALNNAEVESDL
jgi:hypothetical protein